MRKYLGLQAATALCVMGSAAWAAAQNAPAPQNASVGATTPSYSSERWSEDYGYLRDPSQRKDLFDPIKYIPLNSQGDWYLTLGSETRYRYEYFNNNTFGSGAQDPNGYNLFRELALADVHLGPNLRFFGQVQTVLEDGRNGGFRSSDENQINLEQGFFDVRVPFGDQNAFTLRSGRQQIILGNERLVSNSPWSNAERTFDGFRGMFDFARDHLDVFWVRPTTVHFTSPYQDNQYQDFAGVYNTLHLPEVFGPKAKSGLDTYFFYLRQQLSPTVTAASDTYTVGARFFTVPKPFDFETEDAYQFGRHDGGNISAYNLTVYAGYTFPVEWDPRVCLGFDVASGDQSPSSSNYQTFNQLFPLGHKYFGFIDVIGRQNIIDLHPEFWLYPSKAMSLHAEYHLFWRESTEDSVYQSSGAVLRPAFVNGKQTSDATFIGSEVDLLLNYKFDRHLGSYIGYSHFFEGDFIRQTGPHKDIDFAYLAFTYTF